MRFRDGVVLVVVTPLVVPLDVRTGLSMMGAAMLTMFSCVKSSVFPSVLWLVDASDTTRS